MQAPGGPDEDPTGGFRYGGWVAPHWDDSLGQVMDEQMGRPFDLLLGRRTYEIFASYWPYAEGPLADSLNAAKKYVASRTLENPSWNETVVIPKDVPKRVKDLKEKDGPEIQVHGSGNLIQTLLKNDLVDEFRLKIFPLTLGKGKRLFADGTMPASFSLLKSQTSTTGVIVATYERAGGVRTESIDPGKPSEAEVQRRKKWTREEKNQ